jgi:protein-S-isoprenylcysteine O-methyltransferase Ste14
MSGSYAHDVTVLWTVLGVYWLVSAAATKPTRRAESMVSQLRHRVLLGCGYALVLFEGLAVGPLAWRFVPASSALEAFGVALTAAGVAFAIWARHELRANWSGTVTIKEGHRLVRRGPYAVVRNPIYTGFVAATLGSALVGGEVRGLVGVACVVVAVVIKTRTEERFLAEEFGEEFTRYKREVKFLIPFVL